MKVLYLLGRIFMLKINKNAALIFLGILLFSLATPLSNFCKQDTISTVKASKKSKKPTVKLVGVGDSLTHGVGGPNDFGGYVTMIKKQLEKKEKVKVRTKNYGKTGDRSDQITKRIATQKKLQKDLAKADVITLTVGGNDLMQVMQNNAEAMAKNKLSQVMPKAQKKYQKKLANLFESIRRYNQNAPIFIISIYNPFYVYFPQLTQMQKYTLIWNKLAKAQAEEDSNAYYVDICDRLSYGQYDGKSKQKLIKNTQTDLTELTSKELEKSLTDKSEKNDYLSAADHFHPNTQGYKYMTKKLYQVMEAHKNKWLKKGN